MAEEPNPGSDAPAPDPAMMEQLMAAMGKGGLPPYMPMMPPMWAFGWQ